MESLFESSVVEITPLLRWAGSKRQLVSKLNTFWGKKEFCSYIEPFAGAAHFYFSLNPHESVLSDINPELINMYSTVKVDPEKLYYTLKTLPVDKTYYYELRALDVKTLSSFERAVRFLYLNRYCFNGLYRTDLKGNFNVPFSPNRTGDFPSVENWIAVAGKLQKTNIMCQDFESVIKTHAVKNSLVYLDPPYFNEKKSFTEYGSVNFNQFDIERLVKVINYINSIGAYFILSYSSYEPLINALSNWKIETVTLKRKISCIADDRKTVNEILATNII